METYYSRKDPEDPRNSIVDPTVFRKGKTVWKQEKDTNGQPSSAPRTEWVFSTEVKPPGLIPMALHQNLIVTRKDHNRRTKSIPPRRRRHHHLGPDSAGSCCLETAAA